MKEWIIVAIIIFAGGWWIKTKKERETKERKEPPSVSIWTVLKFFSDPLKAFSEGAKQYGGLFTIDFGSFKSVFIASEDYMKTYYFTSNSTLEFIEGLATMQPYLYADSPTKLPYKLASVSRVNIGPSMRKWMIPKTQIEHHLYSAFLEIDFQLNKVCESGKKENLFEFFDKLSTLINARIIVGEKARMEHGDEIARLITILEKSASTPSSIVFPYFVLWPNTFRAYFARRKLLSILSSIYDNHPKSPEDEGSRGELYSVYTEDIKKQNKAAAFGAYMMMYVAHTNTSASLSWSLFHLSQNPVFLEEIKEEVRKTDLESFMAESGSESKFAMEQTTRVLNETIRMQQGALFCRLVKVDDFFIDGFHIPKNTLLTTYPRFFHHDEKHFPEPLKFNPNRFIDKNTEKSSICDLFGHGAHICLGKSLATAITKLLFLMLFSKYDFQVYLPDGKPEPDWRCMSGMPTVVSAEAYFTLTKK